MTDPKPLTDEEQRVHDAACRCREVETNAANGDVCWISRVYEWPKPRPASTWNHDLRIVAADWWNQRATIDALRAENERLKEQIKFFEDEDSDELRWRRNNDD